MFAEEAQWFARVMSAMEPASISPMLNVGSSTGEFRKVYQPWIESYIFEPLVKKGSKVLHLDIRSAPGVDIVGDVADPSLRTQLTSQNFKSVFCSNILEHVEDRVVVCNAILSLVPESGFVFVSCPYAFPYHPDPIDTMYRPDVETLASSFPGTKIIHGEIISCGTHLREVFRSPSSLVRAIARLLFPFYKPKGWVTAVSRFGWVFRSYEATCLVLQRTSLDAAVPKR